MPNPTSCIRTILLATALCLPAALTEAQPTQVPEPVPTNNASATITAGGTFQQLLPSVPVGSAARRSMTIENNNGNTDNCWVHPGGTLATITTANSIVLSTGGSYQRYYPYVPSDIIYGTCATTGDSLYVDTQ